MGGIRYFGSLGQLRFDMVSTSIIERLAFLVSFILWGVVASPRGIIVGDWRNLEVSREIVRIFLQRFSS